MSKKNVKGRNKMMLKDYIAIIYNLGVIEGLRSNLDHTQSAACSKSLVAIDDILDKYVEGYLNQEVVEEEKENV